MIHLRELIINQAQENVSDYPFNVPAVQHLSKLSFGSPSTIFVGENGSGKSTIIEALAQKAGMITIGSDAIGVDQSLKPVAPLAENMELVWNKRTHKGFFLRAEDFFGFVKRTRQLRQSMMAEIERVDRDYSERSDYARRLAKTPSTTSLIALDERYGEDLDAHSHGERFLQLFQSRFVPGGLYLLDEPEAALSPTCQLGLISMIKEMISRDAQFIIATHSPILMAIPGAEIFDFDQIPPVLAQYEDLEHVRLYRMFLADPQAFVRRL